MLLRQGKDFILFLLGRAHGTLAIQMQAVAVHWLIYDITKDPLYLGFIGLVEAAPALSVSLYAGHFADHNSRRKIIIACLALLTLCSLTLVWATWSQVSEDVFLVILFIVILLTGFARGFFSPAAFGLMSQVLDPVNYGRGAAWNSSIWHIAWIIGALSGGWVLNLYSDNLVFLLVTGGLLVSMLSFVFIKDRGLPLNQTRNTVVKDIKIGMGFLFSNPMIMGAMSLDLFAVLFGGVASVLPMFASDVFRRGPDALGILRSAVPAGAFIVSVIMTRRPPENKIGPRMLMAVSGFGIFTLLFALTPWLASQIGLATTANPIRLLQYNFSDNVFWLSVLFLVLSGCMDGYSVVVRSTLIQSLVPDKLRGKVAAINSVFIGSSNEIGAFESGLAAKIMGLVPSIIFGTSLTQLSVLGVTFGIPAFRKLDKIELYMDDEENSADK